MISNILILALALFRGFLVYWSVALTVAKMAPPYDEVLLENVHWVSFNANPLYAMETCLQSVECIIHWTVDIIHLRSFMS